MAEDSVQVSKKTLVVLVASLSGSLLVLAFLLGRMSAPLGPGEAPVAEAGRELPVSGPSRSESGGTIPLPVAPLPDRPQTLEVSEPVPQQPAPQVQPDPAPVIPAKPDPPAPPRPKMPSAEAAKVRKYLAEVEGITAGTEDLGNPSTFATDLLNQSMMGDTSGIDTLLSQAQQSQAALSAIRPPQSCKEHYRLMSAQMKASVGLLQQLKTALQTSDSSGLAALAGQGSAMQTQARRLQQLTNELKEKSSS